MAPSCRDAGVKMEMNLPAAARGGNWFLNDPKTRSISLAIGWAVMSGVGDSGTVTNAVNEAGIHKFLSKNWDAARLRSEVREAYLHRRDQPT